MPALVSALKSVDLPTLGRPTMPHLRLTGPPTLAASLAYSAATLPPRGSNSRLVPTRRRSWGDLRVHDHHCALHVAGGNVGPYAERAVDSCLDRIASRGVGRLQ